MFKDSNKFTFVQLLLYFFVNVLFIMKYIPRTGFNAIIPTVFYCLIILIVYLIYRRYSLVLKENTYKFLLWIFTFIAIIIITGILIKIEPLSVRVDRWSAVTYFLDSLFKGIYPYGTPTHVSLTNFPSPFPMWYVINLPFYLMGDVGIGLIFFLLLVLFAFYRLTQSYRQTFLFFLLIVLSPAYWWEVAVRSDSLSNGFLVLSIIFLYQTKKISIDRNLILTAILCGIIASTRLSAILPIALFIFPSFLKLNWNKKISFIFTAAGFLILTFLPFIFWDTNEWIFFKRNPFMSQSSVGNPILLLFMFVLGIFAALRWKNTSQFFNITSIFIFIFILSFQINLLVTKGINDSILTDSICDISYFSLCLPYCIAFLATNTNGLTSYLSRLNIPIESK